MTQDYGLYGLPNPNIVISEWVVNHGTIILDMGTYITVQRDPGMTTGNLSAK